MTSSQEHEKRDEKRTEIDCKHQLASIQTERLMPLSINARTLLMHIGNRKFERYPLPVSSVRHGCHVMESLHYFVCPHEKRKSQNMTQH